jgi:hypothetical protein
VVIPFLQSYEPSAIQHILYLTADTVVTKAFENDGICNQTPFKIYGLPDSFFQPLQLIPFVHQWFPVNIVKADLIIPFSTNWEK